MGTPERQLQAVETQTSALSLIEHMNVAAIQNTMNKIAQFQQVVRKTLKDGHDYGVIPGTQKPTLLKPGAEKILMLMGLTSEYEVTESVRDYEQGFFAFTVTCRLSRNGMTITEGIGHCNTKEKRYQGAKQDPYTLCNTVLKMSKKRALVDGSLTVASLSDIFTQDMEDLAEGDMPQQTSTNQRQSRSVQPTNAAKASDKQLGFISKIAGEKGLNDAALDAWTAENYGKHVDELDKKEASDVISALKTFESHANEEAATDDPFADDSTVIENDADLPF